MAALSSVEARIKIKSKMALTPTLSISGTLACSRYNQGCNGGYPILVGKHGHDIGYFEVKGNYLLILRSFANHIRISRNNARNSAIKSQRSGRSKITVFYLRKVMSARVSTDLPMKEIWWKNSIKTDPSLLLLMLHQIFIITPAGFSLPIPPIDFVTHLILLLNIKG